MGNLERGMAQEATCLTWPLGPGTLHMLLAVRTLWNYSVAGIYFLHWKKTQGHKETEARAD